MVGTEIEWGRERAREGVEEEHSLKVHSLKVTFSQSTFFLNVHSLKVHSLEVHSLSLYNVLSKFAALLLCIGSACFRLLFALRALSSPNV